MKILHFADTHLGVETYGRVDEKSGLNTRLLDFLRCFDKVVDYAINEKIDLVIFAGDAYKTRDPNPTYQREFAKRIKKIAKANIPVVLVVGNHDLPNVSGRADTLEIFPTLEVPSVYVFSKPIIKEIPITHYPLPITILALPWLTKPQLLSEEETKGKTIEETQKILTEKVIQIFKDLTEKIDPNKKTIVVAHQTISGASYSSEHEVYLGTEIVLPLSIFENPKFDYVALGHLHKHQVLSKNPPIIYSGSIERIDFGEEKEEKGFVVATLPSLKFKVQSSKWKFISLPARKFKTIKIKIPEQIENQKEFLRDEIKKYDIKDAIVRVQIKSKKPIESILFENELKDSLRDAFYLASITKEFKEGERAKIAIEEAEKLTPLEWLEKYLKEKGTSESYISSLKKEAEKLMEEISAEV